jgi:hypothetical protein
MPLASAAMARFRLSASEAILVFRDVAPFLTFQPCCDPLPPEAQTKAVGGRMAAPCLLYKNK